MKGGRFEFELVKARIFDGDFRVPMIKEMAIDLVGSKLAMQALGCGSCSAIGERIELCDSHGTAWVTVLSFGSRLSCNSKQINRDVEHVLVRFELQLGNLLLGLVEHTWVLGLELLFCKKHVFQHRLFATANKLHF